MNVGRHSRAVGMAVAVVAGTTSPLCAQNVVDPGPVGHARAPTAVTVAQVNELLSLSWIPRAPDESLRREVEAFCAGHPWRPFHSVLGISGFETYFAHPDEMFFVLSLAGPRASPRLRPLLLAELEKHPPYAKDGFAFGEGAPRERYHVPPSLLPAGRQRAGDLFGVYAFDLFCRQFDVTPSAPQLDAVRSRVQPLLDQAYPFDARQSSYSNDEAEHLNGDLAGLLGAWRLVHRFAADPAFESAVVRKARDLLERRLTLERVNLRPWTPTHFASKSLHTGKLARYLRLTPELGFALRKWTDGAAAERLATLRKNFPTWWIAHGDRLVGGENFISPLHFSNALWQATAWCDDDPRRWHGIQPDIPWCRGDLSFIQKLALRTE